MVKHVESTVGITVLFDENLTEQDIQGLGEIIHQRPEIREMYYISAEDAWNSFKEEYFAGHEELAEGFAEDNPLAGSASYEIFLNDISQQDEKMPRRYIPKYRRRLGVVFQDFRLLKDRTVFENVAFAQRVVGASPRKIREEVPRMLKLVGLSSKYKSFPHQLSGGEQQRVAIARALINRPEVLLADEPTGNLDHENAAEIMKLLERINALGTTVVVVTHSQEMVDQMGKRVITLNKGRLVSDERKGGSDRED